MSPRNTIVTGVRLIDGTASEPVDDCVIVIQDSRIAEIRSSAGKARRSEQLIDGRGLTALPALIDAHASMASTTTLERSHGWDRAVSYSTLRAIENAGRCLASGITTVRVDTVGHHGLTALRDLIAARRFLGPRLLVPGRPISITGGHASVSVSRTADGPDAMRHAVREEIRAGADWVKLMPTGGAGTPNESVFEFQMTPAEVESAIDAAHRRRRRVFAHVSSSAAAHACIDAGIDTIEHGFDLDDGVIARMAAQRIPLVPTLSAYRHLVASGAAGAYDGDDYLTGLYRAAQEIVELHAKTFQRALEARVPIMAGTDSGADWFPMGSSLVDELEAMVDLGMPTLTAIRCATGANADGLGLAELGTITSGKLADLVLVSGDPARNLQSLRRVRTVFKAGEIVFRPEASSV